MKRTTPPMNRIVNPDVGWAATMVIIGAQLGVVAHLVGLGVALFGTDERPAITLRLGVPPAAADA